LLDPQGFTAQIEDVGDLTDDQKLLVQEQRKKAQRTVAAYATDAEDAAELMKILGIHPSQDEPILLSSLPATGLRGDGFRR
jgi:hypothetical protein